jgi:hypothetical protein
MDVGGAAMSLRFPTVRPSWQYADPALITHFRSGPVLRVVMVPANDTPLHDQVRDRYYTQARRLRVKQLMKGRR